MDDDGINQIIKLEDGETISFSTVGPSDGIPLIIFPGLGNHRAFLLLFQSLATRYDFFLINIDRPGSGLTNDNTTNPITDRLKRVAFNTLAVLNHLNINGPIYLMGQSCGSIFALQTALELRKKCRHQRVMHIFLISPWISLTRSTTNLCFRSVKNLPDSLLYTAAQSLIRFNSLSVKMNSMRARRPSEFLSSRTRKELPLSHKIIKREFKEDKGGLAADAVFALKKVRPFLEWKKGLSKVPITVYHGDKDKMVPLQAVMEEFSELKTTVNVVLKGNHSLLFDSKVLVEIFDEIQKKNETV